VPKSFQTGSAIPHAATTQTLDLETIGGSNGHKRRHQDSINDTNQSGASPYDLTIFHPKGQSLQKDPYYD